MEIFELKEFRPGSQNRSDWLPGMDSNPELDRFFEVSELIDSKKSLTSSKASKAGIWYKIGTKSFFIRSG